MNIEEETAKSRFEKSSVFGIFMSIDFHTLTSHVTGDRRFDRGYDRDMRVAPGAFSCHSRADSLKPITKHDRDVERRRIEKLG